MIFEIRKHANLEELSRVVAKEIAGEIEVAVSQRGLFSIALSGGRTPRLLYENLALQYRNVIAWDRVHLFWGDERYVPKDDPDSNYAMVYNTLIAGIPIPPQNVHRIPTEQDPPVRAAQEYEQTLRNFFPEAAEDGNHFTFDLILQGLGEDGHTASLFPGDPLLDEKERWVIPASAPPGYSIQERITLTYPVLNRSRKAFFVVSGEGKRKVLHAILNNRKEAAISYPAANIRSMGKVVWYVDYTVSGVSQD